MNKNFEKEGLKKGTNKSEKKEAKTVNILLKYNSFKEKILAIRLALDTEAIGFSTPICTF